MNFDRWRDSSCSSVFSRHALHAGPSVKAFKIMIRSLVTRTLFAVSLACVSTAKAQEAGSIKLPENFPGEWTTCERAEVACSADTVTVANGFVMSSEKYEDAEIDFRLRAPQTAAEVQVWAGFRVADEDRRYAVGLRGGNNNQLYLARYAPDANAVFLGIAPLDFKPAVGTWYDLRVVTMGKRIQVYLGDEKLPRINVEDPSPLWTTGGVALGGGYLPAEFSSVKVEALTDEMKDAFKAVKDLTWEAPAVDKEARRMEERATYKDAVVESLTPDRTEVSLNGNWLFMPEQSLKKGASPVTLTTADQSWHLLDVPNMWTPVLAWLHGESGFKLKGISAMKGVSDKAYLQEMDRLNSYTFDWNKTEGGWYRHYLDLPADIKGRKVELDFDAIAKVSEVFFNGVAVGSHVGMFGEIKCDVSQLVQPGKNIIAVHVLRNFKSAKKNSDKIVGVAVTVPITEAMLNSLPHGMYDFDPAGIWQPVKLVITNPVSVTDVYIRPSLDDAKIELELSNNQSASQSVDVGYVIRSVEDGSVLQANPKVAHTDVPAGGTKTIDFSTARAAVKLWSPSSPNLYAIEIQVSQGGKIIDRETTKFGFRTFVVEGNKFLLNGKPYWLRGGDHLPIPLKPNDAALADKFIRLAKAGNIEITRTHVGPLTETWAEATDRLGMMVSFEGIWPWLMLDGNVPAPELLKAWKDDFSSLIHKYRNHPSVVMWTINNEMKFYIFDREKPELLTKKWAVVSDMIKTLRSIDPSRPVVADSGYMRRENQADYDKIVKPNGFDDGDIDDAHRYYNWYNPTFMTLYNEGYAKGASLPDRPLISQEMSTGYPRSDDGLPTRYYLFKHYTPQALVGQYAYEHNNPAYFLTRQAFMTKQQVEVIRRTNHDNSSGVMMFAYLTWFKDQFDKDTIAPWPTYYAMQSAMNPVLVSAKLYGWHYFAGATIKPRVFVVNDASDAAALPAGKLEWSVESGNIILAEGGQSFKEVPYYQVKEHRITITMPAQLPSPRTEAKLKLRLVADGKVLSENAYDITLTNHEWAASAVQAGHGSIALYDRANAVPSALITPSMTKLSSLDDLAKISPKVLVVGGAHALDADGIKQIQSYAEAGGRVLLLNPGKALIDVLPKGVKSFRPVKGEIVSMNRPGSSVFDGIEPLDMSWFQVEPGRQAYATAGVYVLDRADTDITDLADFCEIHAYLQKPADVLQYTGTALLEAKVGKGGIIASELMISAGEADPIARRLFTNMITHLLAASAE